MRTEPGRGPRPTQWHPIFAELARSMLRNEYEMHMGMAVGDLPREADIVLLRRKSASWSRFQGLWRWLTAWNIQEFKGPTESARRVHLDLLVEVGLGIHRRLNEDRRRSGRRRVPSHEVSFWYLANHLGRRFLAFAQEHLGPLQTLGPGLWRARLLGRWLVLVSNSDLPVERDTVPLHLLALQPKETTRQLAELVMMEPDLQQAYGGWLLTLFPDAYEEVRHMARHAGPAPVIDLRRVIKHLGLRNFLDQVNLRQVIDEIGIKQVVDEVGIKQLIDEVGIKQLIDEVGIKQLIDEVGPEVLVAQLTPKQRRELLRALQNRPST